MSEGPSRYVNLTEAARLLGVHIKTLRAWASDGTIYVVRPPGSKHRRVPRSEIVRLLREQVDQARAERGLQ